MNRLDQIKRDLETIKAMDYDFGGLRVYHSGEIEELEEGG